MAKRIIDEFYSDRLPKIHTTPEEDRIIEHSQPKDILSLHTNSEHILENTKQSDISSISSQSNSVSEPIAVSKSNDQQKSIKPSMSNIKYDNFKSFMTSMRKSYYCLYSLTFFSGSEYQFIEEHIGVLCKCKTKINHSFPLYEKGNTTLATWKYIKEVELTQKELFWIEIYTDTLFNKLNQRKFEEDKDIKKIKNEDYLVCVLNEDNTLNMEQIEKTISTKNCIKLNIICI